MENTDFLEFELIDEMARSILEKLRPVVFPYFEKVRFNYCLINDPEPIAKEVTENGHADLLFDYISALLWVITRIDDDIDFLATAIDGLAIMSSESWKSNRFTNEENSQWRERFKIKIDEFTDRYADLIAKDICSI